MNRLPISAVSPLFIVVIGCFCLLFTSGFSPKLLFAINDSYEEDVVRSAKNGDSQSQFALALLYEYGTDTIERNPDKSILWLEKAARGDVAAACLYLGMKYEYGNRVKRNLTKAACWYRCAAHKDWPPAQFFLAGLYEKGKGVKQSNFMALAWFGLAAEQDYPGAADNFSRLRTHVGLKDFKKVRKRQKELMGHSGKPCN